MVAAGTATTSYWDSVPSSGMGAGYHNSTTKAERSFFRMSVPTALYGATIISATLKATATHAGVAASTSHTVNAWTAGEISSTTSWSDMPAHSAAAVASATFTTASLTPSVAVSWDLTSTVQGYATSHASDGVIELINSTELTTAAASWVGFAGNPTIAITYDFPPATPSATSMTPVSYGTDGKVYTSSATPSFSATATSPVSANLSYQFQVLSGSTVVATGTSSSVTSGTSASWADTTALTDLSSYTYQARAYDGTLYGPWSTAQAFTVQTDTPAAVTVTCTGYPQGTWSAQVSSSTCSWSAPLSHMNGYAYGLDGTWSWTTGTSITISPGAGMHTLSVEPQSSGGLWGPQKNYTFGVGVTGAMLSPASLTQTSTTLSLQAAAPPGYTSATMYYRYGTTGTFTAIPQATVFSCGCSVTWPVAVTSNGAGVQTALLSWYVTRVLPDDGPLQIEAVFTNSSGGTDTTPPVTATLNRIGTGADYGTTSAGPFTVGLQSGNGALSTTDVSIASYGAGLSVTRTFNSVQPAVTSIFGPGWTSTLGAGGGWTQLSDSTSYAVLQGADGSNDEFTPGATNGTTVTWTPSGDAVSSGLTLTQDTSANTFTLTGSSGIVTVFSQPASGRAYLPKSVTQPGTASSAGIIYDSNSSDASYGDPELTVAPDPASTSAPTTACPFPASASTWSAGCRGLQFTYNAAGLVTEIDFDYTDNSGTFHSVAVADYGYDSSGRLTSEWDPRLSTPLVTGYAYDETSTDADYGRITKVTPAQQAGSGTLAPWTVAYDDASTTADYGKILSVSRTHNAANGGATATTTLDYSVPLTTSAGGPVNMDANTVAGWGETDPPASAVAVFPPTHVPSSPPAASDWQYAQIDYYDASGRQVNAASYTGGTWAVTTTQYDAYGNTTWTLTANDRATALGFSDSAGAAFTYTTMNVYGCDDAGTIDPCTSSNQQNQVLTDTYGPAHTASVDGTDETIRTHTAYTYDQGAPNSDVNAEGGPYMLVTTQTVSASIGTSIPGSATADARATSHGYGTTAASWALGRPLTTVTDPSGLAITSTSVYNTNSSLYGGAALLTDTYMPSNPSGGGAGDSRTVYYTAGTNPVIAACGNKPEWANLTCQTGPAAQPGTSGLPNLPVTTYTYDDYLNVTAKTETYGTTGVRVTTTTYDADERPLTQAITVTGTGMGTALPETKDVYSAATGAQTDTQTLNTSGTVIADISSTFDDFGQQLTYTDASGNTTTYTYDIDSRGTSRNDSEGTETLTYTGSATSPATITDSQAGTFQATYDPDGNLLTEQYPGGIEASYVYDPAGNTTSVSYDSTSWTVPSGSNTAALTDTIVPDAAGDWATQDISDTALSVVSQQSYTYDTADRLTAVLDTEDNECRSYAYDSDSNRTSMTTATPGSDGKCGDATGAVTVTSSYDSADRETSTGYAFDTQGDIITTPSADAGGGGNLTATYYANDMIANQAQGSQSMTWNLDPTLGRDSTYTSNGVTYTNHYSDGSSTTPVWSSGSDGSWARNVTDFKDLLAARVTASGVTLELSDLHGDIMATASTSTTATGPANTYLYSEFGALESGSAPGIYGWLGADQISSSSLGGQLQMGARVYNSNDGRFAQVDPSPGGSANSYEYASQNPVTHSDLTGHYCEWVPASSNWRTCWTLLSGKTMAKLAAGYGIGGIILGFCAASYGLPCGFLLAIASVLAIEAGYYVAVNGGPAWLYVYEWRFTYRYPVWDWYRFYWAWGDWGWMAYYAQID